MRLGTDGSTIACVTNFVCIDKTSTWTMFQVQRIDMNLAMRNFNSLVSRAIHSGTSSFADEESHFGESNVEWALR